MSLDRAASKRKTHWISQQQRTAQNGKEKPTHPVKTPSEYGGEAGCCPINFDEIERKLKEQAEAANHD